VKQIAVAISWGVAVSFALAAEHPARPPLRVYVTAAQVDAPRQADEATRNALKAKRDRTREARQALEKRLRGQFGKKREAWPADKGDELYQLEEAAALADADYEYRKIDPRGLADSAREVADSFEGKGSAGRKERVALVSSAAEADLVVEVEARRDGKTMPTQVRPDRCFVLFTVGAGGHMDPKQLTMVPADYRIKKLGLYAWKIANPKADDPVFYFESFNGGGNEFGCQGAAASAVSAAVDKFIEDNYQVLTAK